MNTVCFDSMLNFDVVQARVRAFVSAGAQAHTATHCNTLQHTAAHCNTLQRSCPGES